MFTLETLLFAVVMCAYFTSKDLLLSKLVSKNQFKLNPIASIFLTIVGLFINSKLDQSYVRYLHLSSIKGSIELPPFILICIAADIISSILIIAIAFYKFHVDYFRNKYAYLILDIGRLIIIYFVFSFIVSWFWSNQIIEKETSWDSQCYKYQLSIDLATYYLKNGSMPGQLSDFTQEIINPINKSPLVYKPGTTICTQISDERGNILVEGYKKLLGIKIYKTEPMKFFKLYEVHNDILCGGKLKMPTNEIFIKATKTEPFTD